MAEVNIKPSLSFVKIDDASIQTPEETSVYQYIDILKSDISSTENRKNYEVFVTGGANQATVKSTLYQTIFDQDFTLSTSNPLFDITLGLLKEDVTVDDVVVPQINGTNYQYDSAGKIVGFTNELMIREKVNIYRQFAQNLLGDPNSYFTAPHLEQVGDGVNKIKNAVFITFRRLFTRDNINKGTFNLTLSNKAAYLMSDAYSDSVPETKGKLITNIAIDFSQDTSLSQSEIIITDETYSSTNLSVSPVAGEVTTLTADISGVETKVGLIYYDKGIIVLDADVIFDQTQKIRGKISSTSNSAFTGLSGPWYALDGVDIYSNLYTVEQDAIDADTSDSQAGLQVTISGVNFWQPSNGEVAAVTSVTVPSDLPEYDFSLDATNDYYTNDSVQADVTEAAEGIGLFEGTISELFSQATIEDILEHICSSRFGADNETAIVFQNETVINSKIYICRVAPSQLNYSTNPTFIDEEGNIIPLNSGKPFTFVTSIGLFDSTGNLVAVAKTSRPIEKNPGTDLTINVRLDF